MRRLFKVLKQIWWALDYMYINAPNGVIRHRPLTPFDILISYCTPEYSNKKRDKRWEKYPC